MRSLILVAALAAISAPALAEQGPGAWEVVRETHEIDSSVDYTAMLESEKPVFGTIGQQEKATLTVGCGSHGITLNVIWPDFIDRDLSSDLTSVLWRLDDAKPVGDTWTADLQVAGPRYGKPSKELLHRLSSGSRLIVQISDHHGKQEAAFSLSGLAEIEQTVLAMPGCR